MLASFRGQLLKTKPALIRYNHTSPMLFEVKSCKSLNNRKLPDFVSCTDSKVYNLIWRTPLQNILLIKKPWNDEVSKALIEFIYHIHSEYPAVNVIAGRDVIDELKQYNSFKTKKKPTIYTGSFSDIVKKTDLIVTMGGDGTILRGVSHFSNHAVPPVLSFAMGTLGFLLPFDISQFKQTFKDVYESRAKALHRNRLECHVTRNNANRPFSNSFEDKHNSKLDQFEQNTYNQHNGDTMVHAMNDISLHRGSRPHLTSLDIYVDGEFFTTTTGDGLVLSTPTGSTAYSLSAGGSITHPSVPCILLTPINPRSLSFRPIILPLSSRIAIELTPKNRNLSIQLAIDGIHQPPLQPGDRIQVVSENDDCAPSTTKPAVEHEEDEAIHKGIWCIARTKNDWAKDINGLLGFNSSFHPKL